MLFYGSPYTALDMNDKLWNVLQDILGINIFNLYTNNLLKWRWLIYFIL